MISSDHSVRTQMTGLYFMTAWIKHGADLNRMLPARAAPPFAPFEGWEAMYCATGERYVTILSHPLLHAGT